MDLGVLKMAYDERPTKVRFTDYGTVFDHELSKLRDLNVEKAVRLMLKAAPDEFWYGPSSYSGKYHDPSEFGLGGNVMHTKRVFRSLMVIEDAFYQRFEPFDKPAYVRDCLLAAALVHDTLQGSTGSSDHVTSFVDYYSTNVILDGRDPVKMAVMDIAEIAQHHMGRWSPKELVPEEHDWVAWALHTADMQATKNNHMPILKEQDYEIRP